MLFFWDMMPFFFVALVFSMICQAIVRNVYKRQQRVTNTRNMNGHEAAQRILSLYELGHVKIEMKKGTLVDHYDPRKKTIRLSENVHNNPSVAAVAVAAHEVGHALQHAEGYLPFRIRNVVVRLNQVAFAIVILVPILELLQVPLSHAMSNFGLGALTLGGMVGLFWLSMVVLMQLINLPVEFNDSRRAVEAIEHEDLLGGYDEMAGARRVLNAAALTYIAAFVKAIALGM